MITLTTGTHTIEIDANDPKLGKYLSLGWVQV